MTRLDAMATTTDDLDALIDAGEVATILGLAHRNSVSTYRSRYLDFPAGRPAPGGGRSRLWTREEILAWHRDFRDRQTSASDQPSARLEDLVAATVRLLVASPGQEVSIRQIAAEAGVAHSDLYRYATSKDQLLDLAIARLEESVGGALPDDYDLLFDNLETILEATRASAGGMRVLTDRALQGKLAKPNTPLPINTLAGVIARRRAQERLSSPVDPRVLSAGIAALIWGLNVLESRWLEALGLDEIPQDQVARMIRAMASA
jgi:AcrR family transcriptional regulator